MSREKSLMAFARDVFDKCEPLINAVVEKQDCPIYTKIIRKLRISKRLSQMMN